MKKMILQLAAALLSAALLASLWEPYCQSGNAWIALVPLLLAVRKASLRRAFWLGCLAGAASWAAQLVWMLRLTENEGPAWLVVPAWLGLSAALAVFTGLFAMLSAALRRRAARIGGAGAYGGRILLTAAVEPMLWAGAETLRAYLFTGFSWNPLGLALAEFLPLLQPAALGGIVLVSAMVVGVNGAVATLCERCWAAVTRTLPEHRVWRLLLSVECMAPFAALLAAFVWGSARIRAYQAVPKALATVVVQGTDVPPVFAGPQGQPPLWVAYREFAELLPFVKADLWLWPESALPGAAFPGDRAAEAGMACLAHQAQTPLLVGGLCRDPEDTGWYNAAMLFTAEGFDREQVYGKRHLIPFGEYIPLDREIPELQQFAPTGVSNIPGEDCTTVRLPSGLVVGPLICYEDTVAPVARDSVNDGARLLVNMSNDSWYYPSAEAAQHARQAIARCVETGVPMVRAANRGQNTFISAIGQSQRAESFPTRLETTEEPFASLYLRFGETVFGGPCALLVFCLLAWTLWSRGRLPFGRATAVVLAVLAAGGLRAADSAEELLPVASMAMDDGNAHLAERTARRVLATLGISSSDRAKAQEILIRAALERKAWDEAQKLVEDCPELPATHRLAFLLSANNGRGDFEKSVLEYDAAAIAPDDAWGVAALRLALQADLELGRRTSAAERFAAIDAAKGADSSTQAENALEWVGRFPNAQSRAALLRSARQADKGGVFLRCALALPDAFGKDAGRADALATLDKLLALKGLGSAVEARLALVASQLAESPEQRIAYARRAVDTAREEGVRRAALTALGGYLCEAESTAEEGIECLADAVRLNPSAQEAPELQLRIAEGAAALGKYDYALSAYDRWLESYDTPELRIRVRQGKARALQNSGRAEDAFALLTEASEMAEDDAQRRELLQEAAEAAADAGLHAKAAGLYRTLLKEERSTDILLRLARCCEASEEASEAITLYREVRDAPKVSEEDAYVAAMRLGSLLVQAGRAEEAIAEYTRALGLVEAPVRRSALQLERGRICYGLRQLPKARDDFRAVHDAVDPKVASEARFFLVLCLYDLGEDETARELAKAYVEAYPDSARIPDVVLWLAKSDFNRGDYVAAGKGFLDFAERWPQEPRVPQALFLAARSAYQEQEYAATVETVGRIAKTFPQAAVLDDARFLQSEALMELARHGEAGDLLDRLIRTRPDAPWLGEAYGKLGDCLSITATDDTSRNALALEAYREAIARLGDSPDETLMYLFKIGRVLERQQLRDEAADQYTKLVYRVVANPERYSDLGLRWVQRALAQLRAIDYARGNRSGFATLLRRVRNAHIPGVLIPEE